MAQALSRYKIGGQRRDLRSEGEGFLRRCPTGVSSNSFTYNTGNLLLRLRGSVCRLGGQTEVPFTEQGIEGEVCLK